MVEPSNCVRPAVSPRVGRLLPGLLCLVLLNGAQPLWGSPNLGFQGVAQVLGTGSVALSGPSDIALDGAGNIYIADTSNNQIVEVTPQGAASELMINGLSPALSSPAGVVVDAANNLYIADEGNNRVVEVTP